MEKVKPFSNRIVDGSEILGRDSLLWFSATGRACLAVFSASLRGALTFLGGLSLPILAEFWLRLCLFGLKVEKRSAALLATGTEAMGLHLQLTYARVERQSWS
jgi:hypothetical protein